METAVIAKVAVSAAPYSIDKPYDYLVPEALASTAAVGVRVMVPFGRGNRASEGVILSCGKAPKDRPLKAILQLLDQEPVMSENEIALALWMRRRYFCTFFEAIKTILPAGLWYGFREVWVLTEGSDPDGVPVKGAGPVLEALRNSGGMELEALRSACGAQVESVLRALKKEGLVECRAEAKRKIQDKNLRMAELAIPAEEALTLTEAKKRTSPARYEVVRLLSANGRTACADITYYTGATPAVLKAMERAGILVFSQEETFRVPIREEKTEQAPILLNEEQEAAFSAIMEQVRAGQSGATLLQGVTGSGKTQVYLRLAEEVLALGKTAMVLVPEIALTPQMMRKFSSRFGNKVVTLHSSLRLSERYDQWKRIRRGEVNVVLGTRSAVFAPLRSLGLLVIDEEQEDSYRSENPPRYDTREIAKYLCSRENAVLVLGSATPSVETAWAAREGRYRHTLLRRRYNEQALPEVTIADLRDEVRRGNPGLISEPLRRELELNLERGEQSILFLNRRGSSRMLLCGSCGYVPECPNCSTAMTYHSANHRLMCHYCGYSRRVEESCPACGGVMKRIGSGTQRIEEELHGIFPDVPVLRMDADTVTEGHEKIFHRFEAEQIPILIGTQMVAKGLDFPNVTLVGVLSADLALYVDHYQAAERTFDLLTQVIGRAGRAEKQGRAVIQTYTPGNEVIQCAARQDYEAFLESELQLRRLRRCPPFADLFTLTVSGAEETRVLRAAEGVRETLRAFTRLPELAEGGPEVLGPAPAPVLKVNNRYRYRCLWVGHNDRATRERISWLMKTFASDRANRGLSLFAECNMTE